MKLKVGKKKGGMRDRDGGMREIEASEMESEGKREVWERGDGEREGVM